MVVVADHRLRMLKCACTSKAIVHLLSTIVLRSEVCSQLACHVGLCLGHDIVSSVRSWQTLLDVRLTVAAPHVGSDQLQQERRHHCQKVLQCL